MEPKTKASFQMLVPRKCRSLEATYCWEMVSFQSIFLFVNLTYFFRYRVEFRQWEWEDWDYYELEYGWGYDVTVGYTTQITVSGDDVNFRYKNTLGDEWGLFKRKYDVTVYGGIPSNNFKPANAKIDNFSFKNY